MKRLIGRIVLTIFSISLFFSLCTCGLDVYGENMLYQPFTTKYVSGEDDPSVRLFSFRTSDAYNPGTLEYSNAENDTCKGTIVFYKIYDSITAMKSERGSINSSNTQYTSSGAQKAIDLGYKQLKQYDGTDSYGKVKTSYFTIPKVSNVPARNIYIRLFDEEPYQAGFYINKDSTTTTDSALTHTDGKIILPYRNLGSSEKDFDFFDDDNVDDEPKDGDDDVKKTTNSDVDDDIWYVAAYAASYGVNSYFNNIYSHLADLGYIKIQD